MGRIVQFGDHEIPGLLLGAARAEGRFVDAFAGERLRHDGDAAVAADHGEITVGTRENGFAQHPVTGLLIDHRRTHGLVELRDETIDPPDLRVIPESVHIDGVVIALRIRGQHRVLVPGIERVHGDDVVNLQQSLLQTGRCQENIVLGPLLAGGQAKDQDDGESMLE